MPARISLMVAPSISRSALHRGVGVDDGSVLNQYSCHDLESVFLSSNDSSVEMHRGCLQVWNHCIPLLSEAAGPSTSSLRTVAQDDREEVRAIRITMLRLEAHLRPSAFIPGLGGRPVSTRTMVMHWSTGQTSEHRLQPTHSVSSTRGMRASGVGYGPCAVTASRSLRVTGVSAMDARLCGLAAAPESDAFQRGH